MNRAYKKFMRLAIHEARKNLREFQGGPFGACLIKRSRVVAVSRNTVLQNDPTAHAEINAIRSASTKLKTYDLSGCTVYSTTEPCPMCFSALHWAKVDTIIFGTSIKDVQKLGFNELSISNSNMKKLGGSKIKIIPLFLFAECKQLLSDWNKLKNKIIY